MSQIKSHSTRRCFICGKFVGGGYCHHEHHGEISSTFRVVTILTIIALTAVGLFVYWQCK